MDPSWVDGLSTIVWISVDDHFDHGIEDIVDSVVLQILVPTYDLRSQSPSPTI